MKTQRPTLKRVRPTRSTVLAFVLALLGTVLFVVIAPATANAQAIRVHVSDELSDVLLSGVIVEIHRDDPAGPGQGTLIVAGVTGANGVRTFQLDDAGAYRVRARRIGFQPFLSEPIVVADGQTVDARVPMPSRRVALPALVVVGERRCNARAVAADAQVATVWEEVRKALTVSDLSQRDPSASTVRMTARAYERHVDSRDRERRLFVHPPQPITSRPFEARAPAELSASGYVRRDAGMVEYLAPDERVLLSDEFVDDHCFMLTFGSGATAGLIGLEFTPDPTRRVPEIAGVLWIDSTTAELRHLDFWFVDRELPSQASGSGRSGGQVVFARLPDGAWSPVAWRLRMPVLERPEPPAVGLLVTGYVELGAVAQLPHDPAGTTLAALEGVLAPYLAVTRPARVSGVILDSLVGTPLAGATVHMSPARDPEWVDDNVSPLTNVATAATIEALSDSLGRFVFDTVPAGFHRVHASHPALDSAGLVVPEQFLRLAPGGSATVSLSLPPQHSFEMSCTASAGVRAARRGTLFGSVRRTMDGAPLRGATVTATWPDRQAGATQIATLTTRTGDDGIYRICDLPITTSLPVTVVASVGATEGVAVTALLGEHRDVVRRDMVVPTTAGDAVALMAGQLDASRAVVTGRALDEAGLGIPDATVSLFALDSAAVAGAGSLIARARSDSIGNFRLARLPLGEHEVVVQRIGYRMLRHRVQLYAGDTTRIMFTVPRVPTSLGEIRITETRLPQSASLLAVQQRQRAGFGVHLTEDEITGRPTITSVFNSLRGVRLATNVDNDLPGLYPGDGGFGYWVATVPRRVRRNNKLFGECALTLYVDGFRWSYSDLASVLPSELVAVEVFTSVSQVPPQYTVRDGACGAVLVWTTQAP